MSKLGDFEKHVKAQLGRIAHLPGFPENREAIRDYERALTNAATQEAVTRLMDDLTGEDWDRCPSAAVIRRMAYDRTEAKRKSEEQCSICAGVGMVTIWRLVTYRGNSFSIEKIEALPDVKNQESANAFMAQMSQAETTKRQTVLSAAKDCACRGGV